MGGKKKPEIIYASRWVLPDCPTVSVLHRLYRRSHEPFPLPPIQIL
jgi:hypothetical protein